MDYKFSDELIQETIGIFKEEYNHHIDEETACRYLDSLSSLFFASSNKNKLN